MIDRRIPFTVLAAAWLMTTVACGTTTAPPRVMPAEEAAAPKPPADEIETPEPGTEPAPETVAEEAEATAGSEPEETYKNTIKWSTASEVDNFGFDVFRGDSEDGPFERLNEETVEGGGTVDEPRSYQFVDDTIDPHRIYYYYVESISMGGVRERFTPIGKAGPKIKPEETEESAGGDEATAAGGEG